ncbi:5'-nucleotidase [Lewinella marina]|uniref:Bifunctional metallophosphatase/5'-nucleotidase n=1 Tax=Neolewinella marina TaxID=438751 RepID=A0A2G0CKF0_9BACT|nr:5'-nucleotidase C-terminal domain-containing protein [Neolewinella marina]NJB84347.1 5'-nucleotidase [Neolewinella marina]PHL00454.1 bifunctional metallophosphatase/5'-nucleotidase [Neolewinella marina]
MKIDLLYLNDVHGYLEPHPEVFYGKNGPYTEVVGGYARLAGLIEQVRAGNPHTLLFDGGDTLHGTLPVVESEGEALLPILNALAFDAMVGHWDFGYGPGQLQQLAERLDYPVLGINVYQEDGSLFLTPYMHRQVGEVKVAVIGICSHIIDKTMPARFSEGLKVTSGAEELPAYVRQVRGEGADIVILLSHNGFPQDVHLLKQTEGIDVCLSAHTHNRLYRSVRVNDTIVIQCGCHGSFLGHLQLDIEGGAVRDHRYTLVKVEEQLTPDAAVEALVATAVQPYQSLKETVVGETKVLLHRYSTLNASMDNLLLASVRYATDTGIALSNGWRYGAPIPAGKITAWDLYNIVPMNPPVSTVELSGREIRDLLEENLERTFSCDPLQQMGGYVKRCSGLRVNLRIENPRGQRIQEIYCGDDHLEMDRYYKVAFVTSQGVPPGVGQKRQELKVTAVEAMTEYLKEHSPYTDAGKDCFHLV